jgi:hypothetical protein
MRLAMLKNILMKKNQQPASAEVEPQAATSGCLPTWVPPQGRNTNIHPFVGPAKGVEKSEAPHINKDSLPLSVLMMFFTEIFHMLVEQTNIYYQQQTDKPDLAADCLMLRCRT